ncbi:MAG: polysaccharide deacetylase family protein [Tahibacter sp.]
MNSLLIGLMGLFASTSFAAGPSSMATSDRTLWPDTTDSTAGFDRASRAEILVFARALGETEADDDASLMSRFNIKAVDRASLTRVRERLWKQLTRNYQIAARSCGKEEVFCQPAADTAALRKLASTFAAAPDAKYQPWYDNAVAFHRTYRDELLRLAALFGRTNSEIDTLGSDELRGDELPDRQFELTFDDGPSRGGGTSDAVAAMLKENQLSATFYVLGERLDERIKAAVTPSLATLYAGQCVGLHGWEHKSHAHWAEWQSSVMRVNELARQTVPDAYVPMFRPPYGQRATGSGSWFSAQGLKVALWNIDSQDWSVKVSTDQVGQRVLTLMLLWRHGVILFHDIHPKAAKAVPWILQQTKNAGLAWGNCRAYAGKSK